MRMLPYITFADFGKTDEQMKNVLNRELNIVPYAINRLIRAVNMMNDEIQLSIKTRECYPVYRILYTALGNYWIDGYEQEDADWDAAFWIASKKTKSLPLYIGADFEAFFSDRFSEAVYNTEHDYGIPPIELGFNLGLLFDYMVNLSMSVGEELLELYNYYQDGIVSSPMDWSTGTYDNNWERLWGDLTDELNDHVAFSSPRLDDILSDWNLLVGDIEKALNEYKAQRRADFENHVAINDIEHFRTLRR